MATSAEPRVEKSKKPNPTAHLKTVPDLRELRDRIRAEALQFAKGIDRSKQLTKSALQQLAEDLLKQTCLGEQYLGFTMVAISNEFWRDQVSAIDFKRRACRECGNRRRAARHA